MSIVDHLTIKIDGEIADSASDPPTNLDEIPLYKDFFTRPDLYQRVHIHIVGIRPTDPTDDGCGLNNTNLVRACLKFGKKHIVEPCVKAKAYGENTGSTEYFKIGECTFLPKTNSLPTWDARSLVIFRKGEENTKGVSLTIVDGSTGLFTCETAIASLGEDWKEFVHTPKDTRGVFGVEFVYKMRLSECTDRTVDKETMAAFLADTETVSYSEEVIEDGDNDITNNAVLQCWRHKGSSDADSKAVLWLPGRNDCFMHPHVAGPLFVEKGYDVYVLNYSAIGMCRKRGFVRNSFYNSHVKGGTFDVYIKQVEGAISIMKSHRTYGKTVGYAHSTGAPVLINFLMKRGDDYFDGFVFNSPFLDWSADALGSEFMEFVIERIDIIAKTPFMDNSSELNSCKVPKETKDHPLVHYGQEVVVDANYCKTWSQYYYDFRSRPLYFVPLTAGFAGGVTKVHREICKWKKQKKYVTLKSFLCITSRADDTLTASETMTRIDDIGPARCEFELRHNSHDVFLSEQKSDVDMAVNLVKVWMESNGF